MLQNVLCGQTSCRGKAWRRGAGKLKRKNVGLLESCGWGTGRQRLRRGPGRQPSLGIGRPDSPGLQGASPARLPPLEAPLNSLHYPRGRKETRSRLALDLWPTQPAAAEVVGSQPSPQRLPKPHGALAHRAHARNRTESGTRRRRSRWRHVRRAALRHAISGS